MSNSLSKYLLLVLIISSLAFESCCYYGDCEEGWVDHFEYLTPIYEEDETAHNIFISPSKDIEKPANIFTYLNYLMVNIKDEGFHVIDNTDPSQPVNLFFINIPGNTNVAIKDGMLYVDNYDDIVAFTIEDQEISIKQRISSAIANTPPGLWGAPFECVDESQGVVVGWEFVYVETEEELPPCLTE